MRNAFDSVQSETLLSVRITPEVQEAYGLVGDYYDIRRSDLVRMAPLLLTLLAEGDLAQRRVEIRKLEESLPKLLDAYKEDFLKLRGTRFIEYLRDLASSLDEQGREAVDPNHIEPSKEGLPAYKLFRSTQLKQDQIREEQILEMTANEVASMTCESDFHLSDDTIPPELDRLLLTRSGNLLGILTDGQKALVRKLFRMAVRRKSQNTLPDPANQPNGDLKEFQLLQVAQKVAGNVSAKERERLLQTTYIPRKFDGLLLAMSRTRLGKILTSGEKATVRQLFRDTLRMNE